MVRDSYGYAADFTGIYRIAPWLRNDPLEIRRTLARHIFSRRRGGNSHLRMGPLQLAVQLVQRIKIGLGGSHHDVGIRTLTIHDAPAF